MYRMHGKNTGFTLIELLVVVAIIVILIAIILPSLGAARDQAKTTACGNNLRQIGIANYSYAMENNNKTVSDGYQDSFSPYYGHFWWSLITPSMGMPVERDSAATFWPRGSLNKAMICPSDPTAGGQKELGAVPSPLIGGGVGVGGWPASDMNTNLALRFHSYSPNRIMNNRNLSEFAHPQMTIAYTDYNYWMTRGSQYNDAIYAWTSGWSGWVGFPIAQNNTTPRHGRDMMNCTFMDGHVETLPGPSLIWDVDHPESTANAKYWYLDYPVSGAWYK